MVVDLTIHVPDELRRQVHRLASARGETISDVVSRALTQYMAELLEEAEDIAAAKEIEARLMSNQEETFR